MGTLMQTPVGIATFLGPGPKTDKARVNAVVPFPVGKTHDWQCKSARRGISLTNEQLYYNGAWNADCEKCA